MENKRNSDIYGMRMVTYREYVNESSTFTTPEEAYDVAVRLNKRVPAAEKILATNLHLAFDYALHIAKRRFPEAEDTFKKDPMYWDLYLESLEKRFYTASQKIEWLEQEGFTENLLEVLNYLGMEPEVQEYIIQHRPDLIGKIQNLEPSVREKYQHEEELSHEDL